MIGDKKRIKNYNHTQADQVTSFYEDGDFCFCSSTQTNQLKKIQKIKKNMKEMHLY